MINKGASKACTIRWHNGNKCSVWVDTNHNTGALIAWTVARIDGKLGKSQRITGGNIAKLMTELAAAVPAQAAYVYRNQAALSLLYHGA